MSWALDTRKAAVEKARASCGDAASCPVEISFFGTGMRRLCLFGFSWAIVARADMQKAKESALSDCHKKGKACHVIASVCADGAQRVSGAE